MSRAVNVDLHLAATRHQQILTELAARGQVSAMGLAERLGVTHETIRKDLVVLQERGLLRRVHGGAVPVESLAHEAPVAARTAYGPEKLRIAEAARAFLPDEGAVLLDSGTTTLALAQLLPPSEQLMAITNSLPIATTLLPRVGGLTIIGGRVRRETEASVDQWALRSLEAVRVDVAFLGTNAFSLDHGLATPDEAEAAVKSAFVGAARLRVLLADHSKFGRESVFRYATLHDIDVLVTDTGLSADDARAITDAAGVEVVRA
ncbi:MAG: DeoR/GlpR family DNA-binding transcription regulator [Actinobacteria bacterium]|uniref:Lactose phosphotransferase system repressor n=1 Tax=Nostocoides veronense TaxID=330836 RepID=A0ABN2LSF3_9MICO|nr:DeoR/GlpR family DNA-binding transcription regulator [Actinomycetota bacterium]